ncbi:hypothetical protein RF11_16088 [Thelohanellus kitauei]|uniref:Rad21/Rec8-like protein N-terminal domain-containing protein n=1 Tax=Thelohanellus kitauei TaxID=669202 RepID=A0A0C2IJX1_THEKT|nr:hypothetical protein RF11_16088 [Thelohanellus kitauei]
MEGFDEPQTELSNLIEKLEEIKLSLKLSELYQAWLFAHHVKSLTKHRIENFDILKACNNVGEYISLRLVSFLMYGLAKILITKIDLLGINDFYPLNLDVPKKEIKKNHEKLHDKKNLNKAICTTRTRTTTQKDTITIDPERITINEFQAYSIFDDNDNKDRNVSNRHIMDIEIPDTSMMDMPNDIASSVPNIYPCCDPININFDTVKRSLRNRKVRDTFKITLSKTEKCKIRARVKTFTAFNLNHLSFGQVSTKILDVVFRNDRDELYPERSFEFPRLDQPTPDADEFEFSRMSPIAQELPEAGSTNLSLMGRGSLALNLEAVKISEEGLNVSQVQTEFNVLEVNKHPDLNECVDFFLNKFIANNEPELLEYLFKMAKDRVEICRIFIGCLESVRGGIVRSLQKKAYGSIMVWRDENY